MRLVPFGRAPLAEVNPGWLHRKSSGRSRNIKESVLQYLLGKYVIDCCPRGAAIKTIFQVYVSLILKPSFTKFPIFHHHRFSLIETHNCNEKIFFLISSSSFHSNINIQNNIKKCITNNNYKYNPTPNSYLFS